MPTYKKKKTARRSRTRTRRTRTRTRSTRGGECDLTIMHRDFNNCIKSGCNETQCEEYKDKLTKTMIENVKDGNEAAQKLRESNAEPNAMNAAIAYSVAEEKARADMLKYLETIRFRRFSRTHGSHSPSP